MNFPSSALLIALACTVTAGAQAQSTQGREIMCSPSVVRPGDALTIATRQVLPPAWRARS